MKISSTFLSVALAVGTSFHGLHAAHTCSGVAETDIAVTLNPSVVTMSTCGTQSFTATVTGASNPSVVWTSNGSSSNISANGNGTCIYTAPMEPGTYTLTATSLEDSTVSATATVTVQAGGACGIEKFANGGFETGRLHWSGTLTKVGTYPEEPAQSGAKCAWFGGGRRGTKTLEQFFFLSPNAVSETLGFYLHVDTSEMEAVASDVFQVQVVNGAGQILASLASFSNLDAAAGYHYYSFDMTPYKGQMIGVRFVSTENSSYQTSFVLDSVSLIEKPQ